MLRKQIEDCQNNSYESPFDEVELQKYNRIDPMEDAKIELD